MPDDYQKALIAAATGCTLAVADFVEYMATMTPEQRVRTFQILGDYFCQTCGVEQPPGDCMCGLAFTGDTAHDADR